MDVTITYETLFELLRNEKNKIEIQKLPDNFYEDVRKYLKEKKEFIVKTKNDLFSDETIRNKELELINIKKIVKDLYDKRESKIITLARDKSRTKSNLIDTSGLLSDESAFYNKIVIILDDTRGNILQNTLDGNPILVENDNNATSIEKDEPNKLDETINQDSSDQNKDETAEKEGNKSIRLIRFLDAVPKFVGPELEEYGPFEKEDMANLPAEIAEVLINKGRAEELSDN